MLHPNDPRAAQLRRLEELRERQARLAAQRAQQHHARLPGHGHRNHRGK
jgi:hypothetical protein